MTATTQILPWAPSSSANVESQTDYAADGSLNTGYPFDSILPSATLNKTLRQSTFIAAGLANWMVQQGISVPDDGNLPVWVSNYSAALSTYISGGFTNGAFVNLSASGVVSGVGFTNYFASPPAIGSTAANTGAFTTLSATGTVSGIGFSNYLNSPPVIGGGTANSGTFTSLTATGLTLTNPLAIAYGGTNGTATPTNGGIAYGDGSKYAFSAAGTSAQVLLSGGAGSPTWASQASLSVGSATNATNATYLVGGSAGSIAYQTGAGVTSFLGIGTSGYILTAGSTAPQYTNPNSITVGNATTATYAVDLSGGIAGQIPYQTGSNATTFLSLGASGYVLTAGTTAPQYVAQSTLSVGSATTSANITGGAAGSIPYQTGSGVTTFLATGAGVLIGGTTPSYSTAPTLTGTNFTGIPNGALTNSSVTYNGTTVALGGSGTITAAAPYALTIGTGLSGSSYTGASAVTIAIDSTVATLSGSQVLTNKTISGANNTLSNIANSSLTNSSITINGNSVSLGGTTTITAVAPYALTLGAGLTGTSYNGGAAVTTAIDTTVVATLTGIQTLTNKTISGSNNTLSNIGNSSLTNSSITFGSTAQALGSTVTDISGVTIGGSSASTGAFTTLSASSTFSAGTSTTDTAAFSGIIYRGTSNANDWVAINGTDPIAVTTSRGITFRGTFAATATTTNNSFYSAPTGANSGSPYTVNTVTAFQAGVYTLGTNQTVTSYYGLTVTNGVGSTSNYGVNVSAQSGATNNYGIYLTSASGANTYNIYAQGSAFNYLAGVLGIGKVPLNYTTLRMAADITSSTTCYGALSSGAIQSDVTNAVYYYISLSQTAAASFTLSSLYHFGATQSSLGSGSTVTNQYGFNAASTLTGATNNYGFYSNIATGTNAWNFYAAGSAPSYFAGGITPRVSTTASSATITPTGASSDLYTVTALATGATIAAPSGTPVDGQRLTIRIKDNGTAQALTWTTTSGAYRQAGVALPTTTVISKVLYVGVIYNAQDTYWDVVAVAQQ